MFSMTLAGRKGAVSGACCARMRDLNMRKWVSFLFYFFTLSPTVASSRPPQQQHHERVSISGITVDGGSSINTVENNISNNNGIDSNVTTSTKKKRIRNGVSSRKRKDFARESLNNSLNSSILNETGDIDL